MVFILRFALDETNPRVYQEAIRGLYYLVANEPDERCLDLVESYVPSGLQPGVSSSIYAKDETKVSSNFFIYK